MYHLSKIVRVEELGIGERAVLRFIRGRRGGIVNVGSRIDLQYLDRVF